jgi:hypothetical protein
MSLHSSLRRIGVALTMATALVGITAGAAVVDAGTSVRVTVSCNSNPERATITNRGTTTFKVTKVGSTYLPRSGEPYSVNKTLSPGQSVTYQTGYAATTNVLSHQYIYNNDARDGARVTTSVGVYTSHC